MKTYSEKLKDPRWQKKRLEILNRDDWKCQKCFRKDTQLHVHHLYYVSRREPWEYPDFALQSICKDCHSPEPCRDDSGNCTAEEWEVAAGLLFDDGANNAWHYAADIEMAKRYAGLSLREIVELLVGQLNAIGDSKSQKTQDSYALDRISHTT